MVKRSFSELKSNMKDLRLRAFTECQVRERGKNYRITIKFKRIAKCNFQKLNMWLLHKHRKGSVKDLFQLMYEGISMMINLFKEHLRDRIYIVD